MILQRKIIPSSYLLLATDSSFPSVFSFLFLGCGLCTNVQSWAWNWHSTQLVCPSFITHLLFRLLHASHGLSFRLLTFNPESPDVELLILAERCALPLRLLPDISIEGSILRGLREAIAMGAVRAIAVGVDMV
jgi:hypothetical protein